MQYPINRVRHARAAFGEPAWRWLIVAPLAVLGVLTLIRDELLSPEIRAELGLGPLLSMLPNWSWQTWISIILVASLLVLLEGSYRVAAATTERADAKIAELEARGVSDGPVVDWIDHPKARKFAPYKTWSEPEGLDETERMVRMNKAANSFQQYNSDGHLRIRGTPGREPQTLEDVPEGIWREQQIDRGSIFTPKAKTEYLSAVKRTLPGYYRLAVRRSEVERLFGATDKA